MENIILSTDSICDLPKEFLHKYNVHITPLHVILGEDDYLDGLNIKPTDLFDYYDKYGILPKTTAIAPGEYVKYFKEMKKGNEDAHILHFTIGSAISACFQNANIAKEEISNLHVIDTKNVSGGSGFALLEAIELLEEGYELDEVIKRVRALVENVVTVFVPESLRYMESGGRIPKGTTSGTDLLKIKVRLRIKPEDNGQIRPDKIYRGNFDRAIKKLIKDILKDKDRMYKSRVIATGAKPIFTDPDFQHMVESSLKEAGVKEVIFEEVGCVISSHCGPNTLGLQYVLEH